MYSFMASFVSGYFLRVIMIKKKKKKKKKKIMSIAEAKAWVVLMMCHFSSTVTVSASALHIV